MVVMNRLAFHPQPGEINSLRLLPPTIQQATHWVTADSVDRHCPMCEAGFPREQHHRANIVRQKQVRFPRSKKQRIQKKWRRNLSNYKFEVIGVVLRHDLYASDFARISLKVEYET